MKITPELVEYVSALSKLRLDESEKVKLTGELEQIVTYMEILNQVDTVGVEPMSHVLPVRNVTRPDAVEQSFDREELLKNAPKRDKETFLAPKTVE